jgi:hypothetical protein
VYALAFAPDGRLLLSGGQDNEACLWEVATAKAVRRFPGHKQGVAEVAFAPDGRTVMTAELWETAHLWETLTGREIGRFGKHGGFLWGLAYSPTGRLVATSGGDGLAVVWQLARPETANRAPVALTADALARAWGELANADAGRAFDATATLSAAPPEQTVPFLRQHLRPAAPPRIDAKQLEQLVAELDARSFQVRERASRELRDLGSRAGPAVRRALANPPSPEARRRLEALVQRLSDAPIPPASLQAVRALRVLEEARTPEARKLLEELAPGAPDDVLTQEAATVLARLPRPHPGERTHQPGKQPVGP